MKRRPTNLLLIVLMMVSCSSLLPKTYEKDVIYITYNNKTLYKVSKTNFYIMLKRAKLMKEIIICDAEGRTRVFLNRVIDIKGNLYIKIRVIWKNRKGVIIRKIQGYIKPVQIKKTTKPPAESKSKRVEINEKI